MRLIGHNKMVTKHMNAIGTPMMYASPDFNCFKIHQSDSIHTCTVSYADSIWTCFFLMLLIGLQICMVHDLAESLVGDITPYDGVSKEDKRKLEEVKQFTSFHIHIYQKSGNSQTTEIDV